MTLAPYITVGVPVYRGESVIQETLRSIQQQTYKNIEVIISLDGPQPEVERLCQPFLKDSRFRLVVQPENLGWVRNTDYLMAQVETPYWWWHPQDDWVDPSYLEVLVERAERTPEAAVVYCDILNSGLIEDVWIQPSATGDAIARELTLLGEQLFAVAFHGLARLEALRCAGGIRANEAGAFAVDTTWMAGAARWGELQRVPVQLYHKRVHGANTSLAWDNWTGAQRRQAWVAHCADMLQQCMQVLAQPHDRHLLWLAALRRLLSPKWTSWFKVGPDSSLIDSGSLVGAYLACLEHTRAAPVPAWLGHSWEEIRQFTLHDLSWIEATAVSRDRTITDLSIAVADRNHELSELRASNTWRLALMMRRIRGILIPSGSRRERVLLAASGFLARLRS